MEAIEDVLWNSTQGLWFDFDFKTGLQRTHFYPSDVFPFFVGCVPSNTSANYENSVKDYLQVTDTFVWAIGEAVV